LFISRTKNEPKKISSKNPNLNTNAKTNPISITSPNSKINGNLGNEKTQDRNSGIGDYYNGNKNENDTSKKVDLFNASRDNKNENYIINNNNQKHSQVNNLSASGTHGSTNRDMMEEKFDERVLEFQEDKKDKKDKKKNNVCNCLLF